MSILTDVRQASQTLVDQLSHRLADLPKPVLAVIGAGDMATERLLELTESLRETLAEKTPDVDVRELATDFADDFPAKAQQALRDFAAGAGEFVENAPTKAGEFFAELSERLSHLPAKLGELQESATDLPGKVTEQAGNVREQVGEFAEQLAPENIKETASAYAQLAGTVVGNLAERGEQVWDRIRGVEVPVVVEAAKKAPTKPVAKAAKVETKPVAAAKATPKAAAVKPAAAKPAAPKPAAPKAAAKPAAPKPAAPKPAAPKPAAPKAAATTATPAAAAVDPKVATQPTLSDN